MVQGDLPEVSVPVVHPERLKIEKGRITKADEYILVTYQFRNSIKCI